MTAFSLVIMDRLSGYKEETLVYSLIFSGVSAIVGSGLFVLSGLFAFAIASTHDDEARKSENLKQCFHMFLMGMFAVGPIVLLFILSIFP